MLDEKFHVDMNTGCLCRYVHSDTEYFRPHYHNYYELFLVLRGDVCHFVNGKSQTLREGQFLFIRDFDVHDYIRADGKYFEFINFAFTKKMFDSLFDYLEIPEIKEKLLTSRIPPCVSLLPVEKEKLFFLFTEINQRDDAKKVTLKAKRLLADVFLKYFCLPIERKNDIPLWLEMTREKMTNPKNFIFGVERMCEISGKSHEHLSREFKRHYGVTPTEFVTQMRLGMAANLLLTSNLSVTDICYECGFSNISWFYKCFYGNFAKTPVQYRNANRVC